MEARAERVALSVDEATALGERVLREVGFSPDEARIMFGNLLDAELCGYPALGMARLLTIVEDPRTFQSRAPVRAIHETPVSALLDGGNHVGLYALHRAAEVAIEKARANHFALVGLHNSYLSGRNARYVEMIARAGFVCVHTASTQPFVAAMGGRVAELGANPVSFGMPCEPDPFIFDMGTSAITHGEIVLADRLQQEVPEGVAIDADGRPTRNAAAALEGAILPFGGHKGFGLSLIVQALCVMAGNALPTIPVKGFGFLFIVFDPALLMPADDCKRQLRELIERVRSTPRQPGVNEIRIPSERAFRERERRRREGIMIERRVHEKLVGLLR